MTQVEEVFSQTVSLEGKGKAEQTEGVPTMRCVDVEKTEEPEGVYEPKMTGKPLGKLSAIKTISIANDTHSNGVKELNVEVANEQSVKEEKLLTDDDLQEVWFGFIKEHGEELILAQTMKQSEPQLAGKNLIVCKVYNANQKKELEDSFPEIKAYMEQIKGVKGVTMKVEIVETEVSETIVKTTEEIWKEMREQDENIGKLASKLQLELQ